jgi:hypothetical protein
MKHYHAPGVSTTATAMAQWNDKNYNTGEMLQKETGKASSPLQSSLPMIIPEANTYNM